jgi:predicted nuclease of predicted toxin-antitoxin system
VRLLLDENLSHRACSHLRAAGHDAVHVADLGLSSADDEKILLRARRDGRVMVSCDHDFVQMLFASGEAGPSLVLTREVDTLPAGQIAALLVAALTPELAELLAAGAIATLTPTRVRVRPLPVGKHTGL